MAAPQGPFNTFMPPESIMFLQHAWRDTPEGTQLTSRVQVGVIEPGQNPLWMVRLHSALVRALYGQGGDSRHPLRKWVQHCAEEFGNLQRILPQLYAQRATLFEAAEAPSPTAAGDQLHVPGQAQDDRTAEL
jgi:hypothetical protein